MPSFSPSGYHYIILFSSVISGISTYILRGPLEPRRFDCFIKHQKPQIKVFLHTSRRQVVLFFFYHSFCTSWDSLHYPKYWNRYPWSWIVPCPNSCLISCSCHFCPRRAGSERFSFRIFFGQPWEICSRGSAEKRMSLGRKRRVLLIG